MIQPHSINLQNIQTALAAQYKKTKPIEKRSEALNRHFSKEDIQTYKAHGKIFNIAMYQRNANQNYSEVSLHTSQKGQHKNLKSLFDFSLPTTHVIAKSQKLDICNPQLSSPSVCVYSRLLGVNDVSELRHIVVIWQVRR